jgi:hypothetical protein
MTFHSFKFWFDPLPTRHKWNIVERGLLTITLTMQIIYEVNMYHLEDLHIWIDVLIVIKCCFGEGSCVQWFCYVEKGPLCLNHGEYKISCTSKMTCSSSLKQHFITIKTSIHICRSSPNIGVVPHSGIVHHSGESTYYVNYMYWMKRCLIIMVRANES